MEPIFNINGLMFWDEKEIHLRRTMEAYFEREMKNILLTMNPAWRFHYVEAPLLTPRSIINKNYTNDDVFTQSIADSDWSTLWVEFHKWLQDKNNFEILKPAMVKHAQANHMNSDNDPIEDAFRDLVAEYNNVRDYEGEAPSGKPQWATLFDIWCAFTNKTPQELVLRPETTPGSYTYACHLLNHQATKPPFVVWQAGKSFRREQDQVTKNMRLKEFYQQEFQCVFTSDTLNDYHANALEPVRKMIAEQVHLPSRIIASDRLPSYSLKTFDVEINNGDKWMEVCSISLRTDFPMKAQFQAKGKVVEKDLLVLEVALGLDRMIYNWHRANEERIATESPIKFA